MIAIAYAAIGSSAYAQTRELSTRGELIDRVAAVVGDGVVLMSQLDNEVERITARLRENKTELPPRNVLRKQVLERLESSMNYPNRHSRNPPSRNAIRE